MADSKNSSIGFGSYVRHLSKIVFSSFLVIGLIVGISLLILGESTLNLDIGLDFSAFDGVLVMLGLPIFSVVVCVLLSPVSFFIFRTLSKRRR